MDLFKKHFDAFRSSAFRLELLPEYRVGGSEADDLQKYLAGQASIPPTRSHRPWVDDVARWVSEGKLVQRVRAVPKALTPYFRYEVEWCYPANLDAGEQIRFISSDQITDSASDFWLFDDQAALELQYASDGAYLGASKLSNDRIESLVTLKEMLLERSASADKFYSALRIKGIEITF